MRRTIVKCLICISFIGILSCNKYRTEDSLIPGSNTTQECTLNAVTNVSNCLAKGPGFYVYDAAYGGRTIVRDSVVGAEGALSVVLPDGWYEGRIASITDADLLSSNIQTGTNIFQTSGDLTAGGLAACGSLDSHIANTTACDLAATSYIYSADFGGRALACPASGDVTASCWLTGAGWYLNGSTPTSCSSEGPVSGNCRVPSSSYWYSASYGGRSANCALPGVNGSACWTNQAGVYVLDAACADGYNGAACSTPSAKYVYTSEYGGRNVDCTNNSAGSCWFAAAKNIVEGNLVASNIKLGQTIFGIAGSYNGVDTLWGSSQFRDKTETQISIKTETTTYAGINSTLPAGYRAIPNINTDTEGAVLEGAPQVTKVDRSTWAATACGAAGSISTRIASCATAFGANATWNGTTAGDAGQSIWRLVSRTGAMASGKGREVWQDDVTGLLWSSVVSTGINWCKAIGSSNSLNDNVVTQNLNEDDPNNICDQIIYQNQATGSDVVSGCVEVTGFTTTDAAIDNAGKAGLDKAATPSVLWRVPTIYDYMIANNNGIRYVLPDMQSGSLGSEWTATLYSMDRASAIVVDAASGQRSAQTRSFLNNLRCVGR